jgi:AcrR family transcriptional regulator
MPKIVDWDAKRDEILSATWRVIARDGIAKTTIRAIAREADCSHGILSHYFSDKADILGAALVMSHRRVRARIDGLTAEVTGLEALRLVMLEALPLDARRDLEAQIEISFWSRVVSMPDMRELQNLEFDSLWDRLHRHLEEAKGLDGLRRGLDLDLATHQLVALIDGLSAERVLYPSRVPPDRQVQMLDGLLDSFTG